MQVLSCSAHRDRRVFVVVLRMCTRCVLQYIRSHFGSRSGLARVEVPGVLPVMSASSRGRSQTRCCSRSRSRRDAEEGDCLVQVVGAFSDEILCTLQLPRAGTVLDVKRRVQATQGINVFRQRLVISPAGRQAEDREILASLPGLRLQLIKLDYLDDDEEDEALLDAAEEGAAPHVERLMRLPLRPDGSQPFAIPLIIASGSAPLRGRGRQGQGGRV